MRFRLIAFLLGAMLAVIPLIIHLIYQRQGQRVYFSTLRFLKLCVRKTARRKRIENLLLLLSRMALLGLLAMALAEPLIPSKLAGSGQRDTVIILDNSYSMGTRELGAERFRTAKEVAADLLRESPFDVMLIDHRMAGMSGTEFYEAAIEFRPELAQRAIFMSGDVLNPDLLGFATQRGIRLLAKPFDIDAVIRTVREALAAADEKLDAAEALHFLPIPFFRSFNRYLFTTYLAKSIKFFKMH